MASIYLSIYHKEDGRQRRRETHVRELGRINTPLWIDLQSSSKEEEVEWIETKCDFDFQTPQEIVGIESSACFFEQNDTINANFLQINSDGYHSENRKRKRRRLFS
jgi:magnesium transporter